MALQKKFEINNSGISAEYLKISLIQYIQQEDMVLIHLDAYYTKAAREEGKQPINVITIELKDASLTPVQGETLMQAYYNKIKQLDAFAGAVDV